jgi:large subunit ribosomal protein L10
MLKADKERVVEELVERLSGAETLLIADYRGLTHKELDAVRTELLNNGARFSVVKNSLTKRAATTAGLEGLEEFLDGPTAIAFVSGGDMVAVAKVLSDTAQQTRRMSLKGGILQGKRIDGTAVRDLASLPPTEVLRGQLLGAIVGPVSAIVSIFAAPLREFVGVLDARIRQLEEQGASAPVEPPADTAPEALADEQEPATAQESLDEELAPAGAEESAPAETVTEQQPEQEEA